MKNTSEFSDAVAKIQEQLVSLNKKLDVLMMRALVTSPGAPAAAKPVERQDHHNAKPMYQIICADCKKESSLPFKPSGDRPVYCKECFARRRSAGNPVQVAPPVQIVKEAIVSVPPAKVIKKKAAAKKTVVKKKPAAKKKKK